MMLHWRPKNVCAESAAVGLVLAVASEPNLTGAGIRLFGSDFLGWLVPAKQEQGLVVGKQIVLGFF